MRVEFRTWNPELQFRLQTPSLAAVAETVSLYAGTNAIDVQVTITCS